MAKLNEHVLTLASQFVTVFQSEDPYQIRAWAFDRAPRMLQELSTGDGDEDWVFYIPPLAVADDNPLYWIENLDSSHRTQVIRLRDKGQIRIVRH